MLRVLVALAIAAAGLAVTNVVNPAGSTAHAASLGSIMLRVQSARSVNSGPGFVHKGDPIAAYKWLINQDDTGDPGTLRNQGTQTCLPATAGAGASDNNVGYADTCQWPSTRKTSGWAPIVAHGGQGDLSLSKSLDNLPAGKYLISVTADGFNIDGAHFTVDGRSQTVTVE